MSRKLQERAWPEVEPEVSEALRNFGASVKAWSAAVAREPQSMRRPARQLGWRLALSVAMGCLLAVVMLTVAVARYRAHVPGAKEVARASAPQTSPSARQIAAAQPQADATQEEELASAARDLVAVERLLAREDGQNPPNEGEVNTEDELLSAVRGDVMRQVPSAMEPLAQLAASGAAE